MSVTLKLFSSFILRDLGKNRLRTFLTISGIALGVAVVLAISLANDSALDKFKQTVNLISGNANLELRPTTSIFIDERFLEEINWLWLADSKFTPLIEDNIVLNDENNTLVQLIGINMLADKEFKNYSSTSGEINQQEEPGGSKVVKTSALEPDTVFVGGRLARQHGWHIGDFVEVLIGESVYRLKIADVLSEEGLGGAFSGDMLVTDISNAQKLINAPGKITAIEIIAPQSDLAQISEKLREQLPPDILIQRPEQRGAQVEKMTRSFEYNLLALTFIALLVGMFLIYNTMTISVLRRRPEIGTLRALGTSRRTIFSLFAAEAILFGTVGSIAGLAVGLVFAQGALAAIATTFQHFYFKQPLDSVSYNPIILLLAFLLGVGATVVASAPPAFEAAGIQPAEAVRRAGHEAKVKRSASFLAGAAIVCLALGAMATLAPPVFSFPVFGYVAAVFWILGASMLMPFLLDRFLPFAAFAFGKFSNAEGRIAARSLQGAIGRTSVASASLMTGIAMMVSLAIMIGSFRQTVMLWVEQSLKADLWIQTLARAGGSTLSRISPETVARIKALPDVLAVSTFVEQPITYHGERTNLAGADFAVAANYGHLIFTSGESTKQVCSRIHEDDCIVSETFAIHMGLKRGDTIELPTPSGMFKAKIQGVYYDYASDLGYIIIPKPQFARLFQDEAFSSCAVYIKPNIDSASVREKILLMVGSQSHLFIKTTRELRTETFRIFDRTFSITYALHTIAIIVAMLAVTNALLALTLESRRDFGILRYLGASASQLRRVVLIQAGLLGVVGNVSGIGLGFLLSILLVYVINRQSFGWTVQFSIPYVFLIESSILVLLTAIFAGLIPARLAATTEAPSVMREE
jgi:putative ABC transport system permease protein